MSSQDGPGAFPAQSYEHTANKANKDIPIEHDLPFSTGYGNNSSYRSRFAKNDSGVVIVTVFGRKSSGYFFNDPGIATLPEGFRPKEQIWKAAVFEANNIMGAGRAAIAPGGGIGIFVPNSNTYDVVTFELMFYAQQ